MSELLARLQGDLNASRKAQDKAATLLLGTVLSEVKNRRIELRRDPADADVVDVVRKAIKKRRESIEIRAAIRTAIDGGAANIGAVMGKVLPQFKGRAEGGTINAIAREELLRQ